MKPNQVLEILNIIKAYYPAIKIINNKTDLMIWEEEFIPYEYKEIEEAVKSICREETNKFNINIARILERRREILRERKEREQDLLTQFDKSKQCNPEYVDKKIKECLDKLKK